MTQYSIYMRKKGFGIGLGLSSKVIYWKLERNYGLPQFLNQFSHM